MEVFFCDLFILLTLFEFSRYSHYFLYKIYRLSLDEICEIEKFLRVLTNF